MKLLSIFVLFLSSIVYAQPVIKGRIVAAATGTPVPGSSVFISNSSIGTTADANGYFELTRIPPGKNDLVVSSVGYETSVYSFNEEQLPLRVRVELQIRVRELHNVTVEPSVEEGWNKWGSMFLANFIGQTPNAKHCKIKNEKAIRFRYFKKSNRVIAYADEPIILENKALGYRIKYQMEEFDVSFANRTAVFSGYPFFESMEDDGKKAKEKWQRNRDKAYYGSMMHFVWSVYHDSISQQGFEVRRLVRLPNLEKQRVQNIYREIHRSAGANPDGRNPIANADSIEYYEQVLRQKNEIDIYGRDTLTADSLIGRTEGGYKIMYFPDYLYVTYKKETEDRDYLLFHRESRSPVYQRSIIGLQTNQPVIIDKNGGYYPPQEIFASAYWGWSEKMSDCLPIDYRPSH